ncbi:MAG: hypothetical protein ACK2UH_15765 [Candidatus Promineifilaceae bacterium]
MPRRSAGPQKPATAALLLKPLFEGEERALADGNHRPGLVQRQVDTIWLVVFAAVSTRVFF